MIEGYRGFFAASTGASAAFIGLLFVALSFIDSEKLAESTQTWRRIIANSSFSQLANIFFVSMAGLLPGPNTFARIGMVMAILGLIVSFKLLPQTTNNKRTTTGRGRPTVLGLIATGVYILELVAAIILISNPNNSTWIGWFVTAIFLLYAGALARAWEITGIKSR